MFESIAVIYNSFSKQRRPFTGSVTFVNGRLKVIPMRLGLKNRRKPPFTECAPGLVCMMFTIRNGRGRITHAAAKEFNECDASAQR
jgi:hypothetical protein